MGSIIIDMPMEKYLAHEGIGSSNLSKILVSPADFKASLETPSEETKSTSLGTAVHSAILEPHLFDEEYALQPEDWGPKNKGEGAKKWRQFKNDNEGKKIISFEDAAFIAELKNKASKQKNVQHILSNGDPEVTCIIQDEDLFWKARTDFMATDGFLWDIKTTREHVHHDTLERLVFKNGYHFQAAHHMWVFRKCGLDIKGFGWIFIPTSMDAVHIVPKIASDELLECGARDHEVARRILKICHDNDNWHGLGEGEVVDSLELPQYARKMYEL
jgi:exodeoxyribonuclease VIII